MDEKAFLIDIYNRFPKYSSNRSFLERMMLDARSEPGILLNCAVKFGLSFSDMSSILDEEGVFTEDGNLNETRLIELAASFSKWRRKREEFAKRHYHQAMNRGDSTERRRSIIKISEVPKILVGKMDVNSYIELLGKPYEQILEVLVPEQSMVSGYTKLFDKFTINYRVPDDVITAMIHFMLSEQRRWSYAYFEALATDLLLHRIEKFEAALQHFHTRVNRYTDQIHVNGNNKRYPK
ncbi:hypothetical protein EHV15_34525 [Paenibacillus oralis]|uniref:Uncharacterized protein n=1 Tax=Paenibacillus oralis TaxID=2490856 RepID=A0A3P3T9I3_9BACL|nr:hypothetical protein [Paenibacillus oralis]RRJ54715.1 hypothetical protein EHV15_34525 [Paenibacillus oralis]